MPDSTLTTLERVHALTVSVGAIADPAEATYWLAQHVAGAVEGDALALYIWDADRGQLRLREASGQWSSGSADVSEPGKALADATFLGGAPVVIEPDGAGDDLRRAWLPPGMIAAIAVPLRSIDHVSGVVIVSYAGCPARIPRTWVQGLDVLAFQLNASLHTVASRESETKAAITGAFRTNASRVLANVLDLQTTLELVGRLAVPQLADWCTIDLLAADGSVDWLALVHGDAERVNAERELMRRYPSSLSDTLGVGVTLRTGEAVQYQATGAQEQSTGALYRADSQLVSAMGPHSALIMPLVGNGNLLGAVSFKRAGADRPYDEAERSQLAEHLATRCSQALIHARVDLAAQEEIAERRRTELLLRESQGRTAAILEAALDSIITLDLNGRITECNSAAERMFGLTRAAAVGQPFTSVVIAVNEQGVRAMPVVGSPRRDVQVRQVDGTLCWAVISTSPLLGAQGDRVGSVAMITDITGLKAAMAAVRAGEERNRLALEAAGMGTWDVDVVNGVHTWSAKSEALAGLAPGSFQGTYAAFLELVDPEDIAALETEERAAQVERRNSVTAYRFVWPDGTRHWTESRGRPFYADDGTLLRVTGTTTDVTDSKEAEQALRASEERFRNQYKGFPLPTYSWLKLGDEFVLQDFNDAAEAVTDGLIREHLGRTASTSYADAPEIIADLHRCLAEQRPLKREMPYRYHSSFTQRQLAISYVFVPPQTVMLHTEDVTEARQADQQREAMAQSEKLRALGQMATGIAHDLNQSLMLVASYSDLAGQALVEEPPNLTELADLLTTTTQAALDGGETVKRLLLFTRAAPEQNSERVDLVNVVREAAQLTAPRWRDETQARGRPIRLHVEAAGELVIQGSPAQLRELMTNLIFNSVDALPSGGGIRLRVMAEGANGVIEVVDTGVGMSPEVQARVFEPFYTTKGESGTGLGLAMVFGIVEQHNGSIEVHSAPGEGTTFRITFPLANASTTVGSTSSTTTPPTAAPPTPLRVLVVDDEPMMTKAVARMLRPSGHLVSVADCGEDAVELLRDQPFDVVVSDMGMGAGMNGWELAEAVMQGWPDVRFLLATGWGAAIDPVEAQGRGVEAVLAKPYQLSDLLRALGRTPRAA